MEENGLYTIADAARMLGVKNSTLYRYCDGSFGRCVRRGEHIFLSDKDIEEIRRLILRRSNVQLTFEDAYEIDDSNSNQTTNTKEKGMKKKRTIPAGYIDLKEAGALLGISYVAVGRLARHGLIRYKIMAGGALAVNHSDVTQLSNDGGVITGARAAQKLGIEYDSLKELRHVGLITPIVESKRCIIYKLADIEKIRELHYVGMHEAQMCTGLEEETIRKIISPVAAKKGHAVYDLDKLRKIMGRAGNPGANDTEPTSGSGAQPPQTGNHPENANPSACTLNDYITASEAAEEMGESKPFVAALAHNGHIRFKRYRTRLMVNREDVRRVKKEEKYIGRARTMSITGLGATILYALRNTGILPVVATVGRCAIYDRANVEAFANTNKHYMPLRDVAAAVGEDPANIAGRAPSIKTSYGFVFYNLEEVCEWVKIHKGEVRAHADGGVAAEGVALTPDEYIPIGKAATLLGECVAFVKCLVSCGLIKKAVGGDGRHMYVAREDVENIKRGKKYLGRLRAAHALGVCPRVFDVLFKSGKIPVLSRGKDCVIFERNAIESIKTSGCRYMGLRETAREFGIKQNSLAKYGRPIASHKGVLVFDASYLVLQRPNKKDVPTNSESLPTDEETPDIACVDV